MAEKKTDKKTTKTAAAKKEAVKKKEAAEKKGEGYVYALGRRKRAVATTKVWIDGKGKGEITINEKPLAEYFPVEEYANAVAAPLKAVGLDDKATVAIRVSGGGPRGQAEAARMGISRALLKVNPDYRGSLKPLGFLTRDPREKERKKPGLRKARRAPQWSKR